MEPPETQQTNERLKAEEDRLFFPRAVLNGEIKVNELVNSPKMTRLEELIPLPEEADQYLRRNPLNGLPMGFSDLSYSKEMQAEILKNAPETRDAHKIFPYDLEEHPPGSAPKRGDIFTVEDAYWAALIYIRGPLKEFSDNGMFPSADKLVEYLAKRVERFNAQTDEVLKELSASGGEY